MPDRLLDGLVTLGGWSLDALWLPLGLWTLCALVVWRLDARLPLQRPLVRQRLLVALLLALPLGLALRAAAPVSAPAPVAPLWSYFALGEITVTANGPAPLVGAEPGLTEASLYVRPLGRMLLGGLTAALLLATLAGLAGALVQHLRLWSWLHALPDAPVDDRPVRAVLTGLSKRRVRLRIVDLPVSPFTCGWLRPLVVVPATLVEDADALRLALTHELAHVHNGDALWHGLARAAVACVPWHPLAHRLLAQATLRREQAADAFVLGRFPTQRRPYAHLLLRFGTLPAPLAALAAPVHHLNPRVNAMKHLLDLRARGLVPALLLLGSLAFTLSLQAQVAPPPPPPPPAPETFVVVDERPQLIGGLEGLQAKIQYPQQTVEGRVIVQFVIDEAGRVQDAFVVRGIGGGADEEALRVVREARFVPGKQRGKAVKVQMTLPIIFRLEGTPPPPPPPGAMPPPPPPAPSEEPFVVVEQMPELVGGLSALAQQIRYPQAAKDAGVEGRVIVQFVVDKDGAVRDAEVVRGVGNGLDEEALRVVRQARFRPGVQRGQAVKTQMTLPITFKLGASREGQTGLRLLDLQRTGQTVTGTVVDAETGQALAGANIAVPGTQVGSATDAEGRFVLRLSDPAPTLRLSASGYHSVEVPLNLQVERNVEVDVEAGLTLEPSRPNPTSGDAVIRFSVATDGPATLDVYDTLGRRVAQLFDGPATAGRSYEVTFAAGALPSGTYTYRLTHGGQTITRSLTLAR